MLTCAVLASALLLLGPAKAQPTPVTAPVAVEGPKVELTLPDAVALALRDNRTIRSAYLQRITEKFDLRVAEDKFTPKANIGGAYLLRRRSADVGSSGEANAAAIMQTPIGTQVALSWANNTDKTSAHGRNVWSGLNLTVIQPLLRDAGLDVNMASVRIARLDEKTNRLALKNTVSQTISESIFAYRNLLLAQEQERISRDALARARDLLAVNHALVESGRMAEVDVVQTESEVANQELAVEQATNAVDAARLVLLGRLALDLRTDVVPKERLEVRPTEVKLDRALAVALENHPDYLAQMIAVERNKLSLGVAKNKRLWDVSAVAGTEIAKNRHDSPRGRRDSYGGVQVSIPLGDMTTEQAEVSASVAVKTAEVRLEEVRSQVESLTRDAVRNVSGRWRQVEIARRARDLSARKVEIEREKLSLGRSTNFQVLSFESDLRRAESTQLNAMIDYLNALTILDQQVGTTLDTWQISLED